MPEPPKAPLLASRWKLGVLGTPLLAVMTVLTVAALLLMSVTLPHFKAIRGESEATEDTFLEITTVEARLVEFDGALNGYALSGDGWFESRMQADVRDLNVAMRKLARSLQDDPTELREYARIVTLLRQRDALYAYLGRPEHRGEVARSDTALSARLITERIRAHLWEILVAEREKRYLDHTAMIAEARKSFWIAAGIMVLAFLFGACCLYVAAPKSVK